MADDLFIVHKIAGSTGSNESSKLELQANTVTGNTCLVISKTITEYYPITEIEKVKKLHEDLNRGGGRKLVSLKDLTK